MLRLRLLSTLASALVLAALAGCATPNAPALSARSGIERFPPPDCETSVAYDRDRVLPGYLVRRGDARAVCVPFTTTALRPPAGYAGDFYVDEFTDRKLRERWTACKADEACMRRAGKAVMGRMPPNREHRMTDERALFLLGRVADGGRVDLSKVRRPSFFGTPRYDEPIAALDARTYTVEFTLAPDTFERLHRGSRDEVRVRGWYLRGDGVDDGKGGKVRALVIMTGGGGARLGAVDDPADALYRHDAATGRTVLNSYPNATTGSPGQRDWREHMARFNRAGFDVLSYDRRGVGMSGGYADTNTLQQGRDLLRVVASLRTGDGVRAMDPSGVERDGPEAVALLAHEQAPGSLPVVLLGSSRGTMSAGWAMTRNFHEACDYDEPTINCAPPVREPAIRGAILVSEFTSGPGYVPAETTPFDEGRGLGRDRGLFIGGSEIEHNIVFFPSSAILAGMHTWPSALFVRGLWDYAASLQGTVASYDRVKGPKELVVVRGPHPFETWPKQEKERVTERMIAFARSAALGQPIAAGERRWTTLRELVGTADDAWEESTAVLPH